MNKELITDAISYWLDTAVQLVKYVEYRKVEKTKALLLKNYRR